MAIEQPPESRPGMNSHELAAYIEKVRSVLVEYGYVVRKADIVRRQAKKVFHNAYTPWLTTEVTELVKMYREDKTVRDMVARFQRTPTAIVSYLAKLDLLYYDQEAKGWVERRTGDTYIFYSEVKYMEKQAKDAISNKHGR